jgi:uncharacterized protein
MIRELRAGDRARVLALLEPRPLQNVLLEHVVRMGALGRVPGFYGHESDGRLDAVLMVGALGGTALEVRNAAAFAPLAEAAAELPARPRHIIGAEEITTPFWAEYARFAGPLRWVRREPVYVVRQEGFDALRRWTTARVVPAQERDLEEIAENSAQQHREDLKEDRSALDPEGFRRRHLGELRQRHWWVLKERGRIVFQVHVGPESAHVVQLGGVFTPPDLRGRGHATGGMTSIVSQLLERLPAVSLFCDEANATARRVYERVGFRTAFHYRSWLLESNAPGASAPSRQLER